MKYDFEKIGRRIVYERVRKGWNQEEFVSQICQAGGHVGRNTISKIESGKGDATSVSLRLLTIMCELFGCEMGYLLGEEGYRHRTRSVTDIEKVTGLDADAVEGLKQIRTSFCGGFFASLTQGEYDDFYRAKYGDFDATPVVNWLFKNENFQDLMVYLTYKLQTVVYDQVHVPDFVTIIKNIFEDYRSERMPMMTVSYDDWAKISAPNGWEEFVKELNISPDDQKRAEKIWGDYMRGVSSLIPFPVDD